MERRPRNPNASSPSKLSDFSSNFLENQKNTEMILNYHYHSVDQNITNSASSSDIFSTKILSTNKEPMNYNKTTMIKRSNETIKVTNNHNEENLVLLPPKKYEFMLEPTPFGPQGVPLFIHNDISLFDSSFIPGISTMDNMGIQNLNDQEELLAILDPLLSGLEDEEISANTTATTISSSTNVIPLPSSSALPPIQVKRQRLIEENKETIMTTSYPNNNMSGKEDDVNTNFTSGGRGGVFASIVRKNKKQHDLMMSACCTNESSAIMNSQCALPCSSSAMKRKTPSASSCYFQGQTNQGEKNNHFSFNEESTTTTTTHPSSFPPPPSAGAAARVSPTNIDEIVSSSRSNKNATSEEYHNEGYINDHTDATTTTTTTSSSSSQEETKSYEDRFHRYQTGQWNKRFQDLLNFKAKNGHCLVPHNFPQNPHLSQWIKRQRYQYKLKQLGQHSTLTDERQEILETMGFAWDSHRAIWDERYESLKQFKEIHGNCSVPANYGDHSLAVWVKCQRRQYKLYRDGMKSTMNQERICRLELLDFNWNPRKL